mmetsp:Transcript_34472/g.75382  ORF Transcript_34472/g.75382 Transcript_34472/m.75382 type:complete len:236 (+) Transcript_34472:325-1032(+)
MSTVDLTVARLGVRYDQTNHVDFISLLLQLLEHFLHLGLLHACIWDEQILALAQRRCQDFFLQFLSRSSQKLHKILVPDMRIGHSLLISSMCQSEHVAIDLDKVFRAIRLARLGEQHLESFLAESGLAGPRGPQYEHRLGFLARRVWRNIGKPTNLFSIVFLLLCEGSRESSLERVGRVRHKDSSRDTDALGKVPCQIPRGMAHSLVAGFYTRKLLQDRVICPKVLDIDQRLSLL